MISRASTRLMLIGTADGRPLGTSTATHVGYRRAGDSVDVVALSDAGRQLTKSGELERNFP